MNRTSGWEAPVNQPDRMFRPTIFERNKSGIVFVRSSQVEFCRASGLGILDGSPKQKRGSPKIVETLIRTAVLIDKRSFETQIEDGGDWSVIFSVCDPNLGRIAERLQEMLEPDMRLWWQVMAFARKN